MKDGAVIANSGHFNVEIDITALEKLSSGEKRSAPLRRRVRHERWPSRSICSAKAA